MSEHLGHSQLEDINEIHVRNPNYKGKNYDPNYQAKKAEANKQQQQSSTANGNQYKAPYTKPATSSSTNNLASCKVPFLLFFVLVVCWFSCSFVSEACAGFGEWL